MVDTASKNELIAQNLDAVMRITENGSPIDILKHPNTPSSKSTFIYQKHVPTTHGTASYGDVRRFLDAEARVVRTSLEIPISFIYGDQQTFSRMVWLKRMEPGHDSCIPLPGDFHFVVHMLMAIHILWWPVLIYWLICHTGICQDSLQEKWSSVELYNRYRFAYETFIVGILAYVLEVVPANLLEQPGLLLQVAKEQNPGGLVSFKQLLVKYLPLPPKLYHYHCCFTNANTHGPLFRS